MVLDDIKLMMMAFRRTLHKMPETGFNEIKTSAFVKEKLQTFGFEIEEVAGTGIVAVRRGETNKKAIAFRADMDGLRVKEETHVTFASLEENRMHACGHDGHMSILLGFAAYISSQEKLSRDIVLIFQPAEEGPGGAEIIVKEGIFKKYNVEAIFGLHIFPGLEEGKIGVNSGPIMAQTGEFDIVVKGQSGHGAMPHTTKDSIYAAAQLVANYQSIVSRSIDPMETAVLSIGQIVGGEAKNVIADTVSLGGTIRAFKQETYDRIKDSMEQISDGIARMYDVKIDMSFKDMYPAVINDEKLCNSFKDMLDDCNIVEMAPLMLAEDFSYYQREVPGLFFFLGSRNEELGYTHPLHSCYFNFNEAILLDGLKIYIKVAKQYDVFN